MPHIHLETTADLPENADVPDILEALCDAFCRLETVKSEAVKAYHTLRSVWHMGVGAPPGFAHVTIAVLTGRDSNWRKDAAIALLQVLKDRFHYSLASNEVSVTVEVREMEAASYVRA